MPDPEALAREDIDRQLELAGWKVPDRDKLNLFAGPGVAIREVSISGAGEADYLLVAGRRAVGIVEAIETQFARLDAAVAALKSARIRLKRYRASILKAAYEGRLVPTESELARREGREYEHASVLLERIQMERAASPDKKRGKAKDAVALDTSSLPGLPEGWAAVRLDSIASHITSGSRDWTKFYGRGSGTFLMAQIEALVETNLKRAETLRQSILRMAFSGQLVPQIEEGTGAV